MIYIGYASIFMDTITVHEGSVDSRSAVDGQKYTTYNWEDLFVGKTKMSKRLVKTNLVTPLLNSVLLSVFHAWAPFSMAESSPIWLRART